MKMGSIVASHFRTTLNVIFQSSNDSYALKALSNVYGGTFRKNKERLKVDDYV